MSTVSKSFSLVIGGFFLLLFVLAMLGQQETRKYAAMSPEERAAYNRAMELQIEADRQAQAKRNLAEHSDGHHCLSGFSGEHSEIVDYVKDNLREPDSFEQISTVIRPVDKDGQHRLTMKYRARNGFGGMNVETAFFSVANADCSFRQL